MNQNAEALKKNFLELTELKHILRKTQQFFDEQDHFDLSGYAPSHQLISDEGMAGSSSMHLGFVAGVILRERIPGDHHLVNKAHIFLKKYSDPFLWKIMKWVFLAFEKMLWRACRGNVFLRQVWDGVFSRPPILFLNKIYLMF